MAVITRNELDSDDSSDQPDYEVGYRKPPKQHRFAKGKSGNPRGRPQKSRAARIELPGVMGALIKLMAEQPGKRRKRPPKTFEEAVAQHLLKDLLGPSADRIRVLKYLSAHGYEDVKRELAELREHYDEQGAVSPEVEREIIAMAEKYLGKE